MKILLLAMLFETSNPLISQELVLFHNAVNNFKLLSIAVRASLLHCRQSKKRGVPSTVRICNMDIS